MCSPGPDSVCVLAPDNGQLLCALHVSSVLVLGWQQLENGDLEVCFPPGTLGGALDELECVTTSQSHQWKCLSCPTPSPGLAGIGQLSDLTEGLPSGLSFPFPSSQPGSPSLCSSESILSCWPGVC
jgi:hypothetical protein